MTGAIKLTRNARTVIHASYQQEPASPDLKVAVIPGRADLGHHSEALFMWRHLGSRAYQMKPFVKHANITDISTYLQLCGRPHKLK